MSTNLNMRILIEIFQFSHSSFFFSLYIYPSSWAQLYCCCFPSKKSVLFLQNIALFFRFNKNKKKNFLQIIETDFLYLFLKFSFYSIEIINKREALNFWLFFFVYFEGKQHFQNKYKLRGSCFVLFSLYSISLEMEKEMKILISSLLI